MHVQVAAKASEAKYWIELEICLSSSRGFDLWEFMKPVGREAWNWKAFSTESCLPGNRLTFVFVDCSFFSTCLFLLRPNRLAAEFHATHQL
jgi:hypothetical protein